MNFYAEAGSNPGLLFTKKAGPPSKGRKRKSRPRRACKGNTLKYGIASIENEIFLNAEGD